MNKTLFMIFLILVGCGRVQDGAPEPLEDLTEMGLECVIHRAETMDGQPIPIRVNKLWVRQNRGEVLRADLYDNGSVIRNPYTLVSVDLPEALLPSLTLEPANTYQYEYKGHLHWLILSKGDREGEVVTSMGENGFPLKEGGQRLGFSCQAHQAKLITPHEPILLSYMDQVMTEKPTAYWRFGRADSQNEVKDWVTGEYSGKVLSAEPVNFGLQGALAPWDLDTAAEFTDRAYVHLNKDIVLEKTWTMEVWFKVPLPPAQWRTLSRGPSDHHVLVSKGGELGVYDNQTHFGFFGSGFYVPSLTKGWHHLAAVAKDSTTTFFVDGARVGDVPHAPISPMRLLGNYSGSAQPFGTIDEMSVIQRALSAQRIQAHYQAGLP